MIMTRAGGRPSSFSRRSRHLVAVSSTAALLATGIVVAQQAGPARAAEAPVASAVSADATLVQGSPTTASGTAATMTVDADPRSDAVVAFTVSGSAGRAVASAVLRLYVTNGSSSGGTFAALPAATPWDEATVDWATAPAAGAKVAKLGSVTAGKWVQVDLGSLVAGDGAYALRVSTTSTDAVSYATREAPTGAPQVLITYATPGAMLTQPRPRVETARLPRGSGDVADDSAIYADPVDPARSVVIADDKASTGGGIAVFDTTGALLQYRADGKIGNVDLRTGFPLAGHDVVLVGANNRTTNTLEFWTYDPATRTLSAPINAGALPTMTRNYGFCLYHSPTSGQFYAFVDQEAGGAVEEYQLNPTDTGTVGATLVRAFDIGSQTEGCVADDERGVVYFGQEDVAIWRYGAEPSDDTPRTAIDRVGAGHLVADIEGLTLATGAAGTGALIVSSQGDSRIAVYDRATGAYLRRFTLPATIDPATATTAIDAVTHTDGVAATTASAGPGFEHGLLVVHDDTNTGGATSNLKYLPLDQITTLTAP